MLPGRLDCSRDKVSEQQKNTVELKSAYQIRRSQGKTHIAMGPKLGFRATETSKYTKEKAAETSTDFC